MLFNPRPFLIAFLALALLLRSAAGLAMQIDMAYGMLQANTAATKAAPPCHEAMQSMNPSPAMDMSDMNGSNTADSSACSLCCVAAAISSHLVFTFLANTYPAPTAALFNSLPAPAQRPAKPPLV
jgi:hypothetical protein